MLKLQEKKRCMVQVVLHLESPPFTAKSLICLSQGAFGKRSIAELQAMRISELKLLFDDGPM